jgi:hypothetical protein
MFNTDNSTQLRILHLDNNRLEAVPSGAFSQLTVSLVLYWIVFDYLEALRP